MKKSKIYKKLKKIEKRLDRLDDGGPQIRSIGFDYLHEQENEYEDEGY